MRAQVFEQQRASLVEAAAIVEDDGEVVADLEPKIGELVLFGQRQRGAVVLFGLIEQFLVSGDNAAAVQHADEQCRVLEFFGGALRREVAGFGGWVVAAVPVNLARLVDEPGVGEAVRRAVAERKGKAGVGDAACLVVTAVAAERFAELGAGAKLVEAVRAALGEREGLLGDGDGACRLVGVERAGIPDQLVDAGVGRIGDGRCAGGWRGQNRASDGEAEREERVAQPNTADGEDHRGKARIFDARAGQNCVDPRSVSSERGRVDVGRSCATDIAGG